METLEHRAGLLHNADELHYVLFTKKPLSAKTLEKISARDDFWAVNVDQLYA